MFPWPRYLKENPIENDLIIRKVFQYCPRTLDTVKIHRLVSKACYIASDSEWKSFTVPLTLFQVDKKKQPKKRNMPGRTKITATTTLSQFLQQESGQNRSEFPQRNFLLQNWEIKNRHYAGSGGFSGDDNGEDLNKRFWTLYGKNVTVLTLSGCRLPWSEQLFEEALLAALPNLERVSLLNCTLVGECRRLTAAPRWLPNGQSGRSQRFLEQFNLQRVLVLAFPKRPERNLVNEMEFDIYSSIVSQYSYFFPQLSTIRGEDVAAGSDAASPVEQQPPQHQSTCLTRSLSSGVASSLRSIRVHKLTWEDDYAILPWEAILNMFPNLEEISMGHQPRNSSVLAVALKRSNAEQRLKKLNIIDAFVGGRYRDPTLIHFQWNRLSLQKLAISCEYPPTAIELEEMLQTQASTLTELQLHRSIFVRPYANFLSQCDMPNLTELHLWGNVFENMDFLKLTPKLRVLKWNTICYDEDTHGARFQEYKKYARYNPVYSEHIVKNTKGLSVDFQLGSMRTLEFERGPVSLECWQKLGEWMPGLTRLKCLVVSDQHFGLIGRLWHELEYIEMSHGSRMSSGGILQVVSTDLSFLRLKSFIWKGCSCLSRDAEENKFWNETETAELENTLEKLAVNELILPMKHAEAAGRPGTTKDVSTECLQNLYELAIFWAGLHVGKLENVLKKVNQVVEGKEE